MYVQVHGKERRDDDDVTPTQTTSKRNVVRDSDDGGFLRVGGGCWIETVGKRTAVTSSYCDSDPLRTAK